MAPSTAWLAAFFVRSTLQRTNQPVKSPPPPSGEILTLLIYCRLWRVVGREIGVVGQCAGGLLSAGGVDDRSILPAPMRAVP